MLHISLTVTFFRWWGKGRTYLLHSRWKEELLYIFQLVDQPCFENLFSRFSLKLATCNTYVNYSLYNCICTDCPNTIILQVIQSQPSCTICNTIMARLDDYVRDCAFFQRMTGCCSASAELDFLNLPPTRMILWLLRNGSSWLILL